MRLRTTDNLMPLTPASFTGSALLFLAQSRTSQQYAGMFMYLLLIALAVVAMVLIAMAARRMLLSPGASITGEIFTLSDLRQMRRDGILSELEYEQARKVLIAQGLALLNNGDGDAALSAATLDQTQEQADEGQTSHDAPDHENPDGQNAA
ncbi:MAG: hypothetical protein IT440_07640 [Phycisphaeraceae bacterium]|nr:hypothetical protein [Phycisphaeraceae bacterium]